MDNIDKYIVSFIIGPNAHQGLYPIKSQAMTYFSETGPGGSNADDKKESISLGFTFPYGGYTHINVNTNGWAALFSGSFSVNDVLYPVVEYRNNAIRHQFTSPHLVCAPWFDDLRNIFRSITSPGAKTYLTGASNQGLALPAGTVEDIINGKFEMPPGIDNSTGGMKYARINNDPKGKCIVVRWSSFAYYQPYKNIVKFDLVVYENGTIEYRYGPRIIYAKQTTENATIGIFPGNVNSTLPDFVDFGGVIAQTTQSFAPSGGRAYTPGYIDTDPTFIGTTASYTVSLNTFDHWPSKGAYGSIIRMTPPMPAKKFNKRDFSKRQSKSFINSGYFDDQNTINAISSTVEYPSMMPVNAKFGNYNGNTQVFQNLFKSGSIQITRSNIPSAYDNILFDSIAGNE